MASPTHTWHIDRDLSRAWSLPAELYFDPAVLEEEKKKIFAHTWQIAARSSQLAQPGDYVTTELIGEPLLLARDQSARLRAFYNICRHRAGPPAEGCGSRKLFRCGYHGWTYGLDGALISAPEFEGVEAFQREEFGLRPLRVDEWCGLVFVNLDDHAEPLLSSLGELPQQTRNYDIRKLRLFERRDYVMQCNWKAYLDNYLEGYHLPSVHPGLNRELEYDNYFGETYARHNKQWSPIRPAQPGDKDVRRYESTEQNLVAEYFWIFPNWMLNCYPDNISLNIVFPLGPEQCVAVFEWYFAEEAIGSGLAATGVKFTDQVQVEDGAICETVQKNLHSRSYHRGRYSVKQEKCVHHFHRLYAEAMGVTS